jgi:hypothetical protein
MIRINGQHLLFDIDVILGSETFALHEWRVLDAMVNNSPKLIVAHQIAINCLYEVGMLI